MRIIIDEEEYLIDDLKDNMIKEISKKSFKRFGIVIDRIIVDAKKRSRIADALEEAFSYSEGVALLKRSDTFEYFTRFPACLEHGIIFDEEITPRHFSFNSHWGYCEECKGIGSMSVFDAEKTVVNEDAPFFKGALHDRIARYFTEEGAHFTGYMLSMLKSKDVSDELLYVTPYKDVPKEVKDLFFYGDGFRHGVSAYFEEWNEKNDVMSEDFSEWWDNLLSLFMSERVCSSCNGARLNEMVLSYKIAEMNISQMTALSITNVSEFFNALADHISKRDLSIVKEVIKEIKTRLSFLEKVGLSYLTLKRKYSTLSGGEAQRIRLASQLGSRLTGVLYVLDEPTVGLHPRDTDKLLQTLKELRDLGNTLVVVEHDADTINAADHVVDMGPNAGKGGGEVVFSGTKEKLYSSKKSLTAKYLRGECVISDKKEYRKGIGKSISLKGVRKNNLKNIDVSIPLGKLVCVSGVSGSGKSSLVTDTLYPALSFETGRKRSKIMREGYESIEGFYDEEGKRVVHDVIFVDQISVSASVRSTLVSFVKIFDSIRRVFAKTPMSRHKAYTASRFTYNGKDGRCKSCEGKGFKKVSMHFLSDLELLCDECKGKRYNEETLLVTYKGLNMADVLELTVSEAISFFEYHKGINRALTLLEKVGLAYVKLGQRLDTLSGGELQRLKLSRELAKKSKGEHTVYILDEPTTGLHFEDIKKLLSVLDALVDKGNSCILIEHHPAVIKNADYVIDLGPEGGEEGGEVVAVGTPKEVRDKGIAHTFRYI